MDVMKRCARCGKAAALAAFLALPICSHQGFAQEGAASEDAGVKQAARKAYEGGVKSYQSGKHQNAIDQLSMALRGGGLSSAEMAKGLYYRGLAYKKLDKPGLAISDLTSALWLKNGLSDDDRRGAEAARGEAYKAAGIADAGTVVAARPAEAAAPAAPVANVPAPIPQGAEARIAPPPATGDDYATTGAAATQAAPAASRDGGGGVPQPLTMGAETAAAAPPAVGRSQSRPTGGFVSEQAAPDGLALAAAPSDADVSAAPSATGGIGTFFSNIFSAGTPNPSPDAAPVPAAPVPAGAVTTASTTSSASGAEPQSSSWSNATSLTQSGAKSKKAGPEGLAAPAETPRAIAKKTKGGKYKVHVAALRSRAEADALAQRLAQEHGPAFADRSPSVDEAVIGSMGTFYRVRVGSYATAEEPRSLCNTLRNSGYDCLVVTK